MLCYRCGSFTPDDSRKCSVCGQPIAARRRASPGQSKNGTGRLSAPPYEPGRIVAGRYRLRKAVAAGTSGWIYRARDEEVDVDVAIKLISANLLQTDEERESFLKAVRLVRKVQHGNLVRIYDQGIGERHVFYTMPFLEGLSLRKIIDLRVEKSQVFSFSETLPLFGQLALAVDGLEKLGGHGALRPSNVVVLPDVLKVTGAAHLRGLPRRPFIALQANVNASEYMAPESRRDDLLHDRRADVYSMAVMFAEMTSGVVYGRDAVAWDRAEQAMPPRLLAALRRALNENREARFETGSAFFEAVAEAAAEHQRGANLPEARLPSVISEDTTDESGLGPTAVPDEPTVDTSIVPPREARPNGLPAPPGLREPLIPGALRHVERRGSGKRRSALLWAAVVTILAGGIAVSAAIYYQNKQRFGLPGYSVIEEPTSSRVPDKVDGDGWKPLSSAPESGGVGDDAALTSEAELRRADRLSSRGSKASRSKGKNKRGVELVNRDRDPEVDSGVDADSPDGREGERQSTSAATQTAEQKPVDVSPVPDGMTEGEATGVAETTPPDPPSPPPAPASPQPACPPNMVFVAGGSFVVGSSASDPMRGFGELAAQQRSVEPFCIDILEYPNEQGAPPQANVTWTRAKKVCERLDKRLCTEVEWERACKGPAGYRFPYGNDYDPAACNVGQEAGKGRKAAPTGSHSRCRSGFGAVDMAGNVAEWTVSSWGQGVPDKVVKGGAADQGAFMARCAARANDVASNRHNDLGFRCCAEPQR